MMFDMFLMLIIRLSMEPKSYAGFEPATFRLEVERAIHCASRTFADNIGESLTCTTSKVVNKSLNNF